MKNILYFTESDKKMILKLEQELGSAFRPGDSVAIKLHMGEKYNPNHLQPDFVRKIVKLMVSMNLRPFLFDSPTKYDGPRHTPEGYIRQAAGLGFTEENVGCPVIISEEFVESKGEHMTYQVCRHLAEADGVLVLSHFKGHACAGIGGAIKNLGMGALTKKSKNDVHAGGQPTLKGRCALCKKCATLCPFDAIGYDESGPVFDYNKCYGCSKCIQNCPQKCLKPRVAEFDELLADGANAAMKRFKKAGTSAEPNTEKETDSKGKAKVYFVNVLRRITNVCDCSRGSLPAAAGSSADLRIVCPDIGILMGRDPCAIDRASVDLVNRRSGRDLFLEIWHKPPLRQVEEAEKLGMGNSDYEIEDVA